MSRESSKLRTVPIHIRRVVTGQNADGKGCLALDAAPPRTDVFRHIPGMVSRLVWATDAAPGLPFSGSDPTLLVTNVVPGPGETRLLIVTFPPDGVFFAPEFDPVAAVEENLTLNPGLAERFEPDGMHATPTIDYGIVLDGEIWLEFDDGHIEHLKRYDVVVQNGTRHAWRNKSDQPSTMCFVLIGATPDRGR